MFSVFTYPIKIYLWKISKILPCLVALLNINVRNCLYLNGLIMFTLSFSHPYFYFLSLSLSLCFLFLSIFSCYSSTNSLCEHTFHVNTKFDVVMLTALGIYIQPSLNICVCFCTHLCHISLWIFVF